MDMNLKEPSFKERTIDIIGELGKDTFTIKDILPHFPDREPNNISATLSQLVDSKLLYRTGKRIKGMKPKGHYVEYTTSMALAYVGGDNTATRGWSADEINKAVDKKLMSEQEKQIECLKKKLLKVREENKKLRKIIASLNNTQLLDIILGNNGQ